MVPISDLIGLASAFSGGSMDIFWNHTILDITVQRFLSAEAKPTESQ